MKRALPRQLRRDRCRGTSRGYPRSARRSALASAFAVGVALLIGASTAAAQLIPPHAVDTPEIARPEGSFDASFTAEVRVHLDLLVDVTGLATVAKIEGHTPEDAPSAFVEAAVSYIAELRFHPARKDGTPIKSHIPYTVVFHEKATAAVASASPSASAVVDPYASQEPPLVAAPAASTAAPVSGASAPAASTAAPVPSASAPASGASAPVSGASAPVPSTAAPVSGASAPVPSTAAPVSGAAAPASGPTEAVSPPVDDGEIRIVGAVEPRGHGASDVKIAVGPLSVVPRGNASDFLKLAPGILLTNEGGEGHAEQVFLRGFDAREGQDIEFSVDGVPMNDAGNIHGNGYTDTHFIIPELIRSLRVVEGPFSPSQGNFAVAGSADYQLGLEERGTTAKITYGSFNTERALILFGPADESVGTFGAAELYKTDGFGTNRAAQRGSAMGQYEVPFAKGLLRVTMQAYGTHYQSAGLMREDDVGTGPGQKSFYGTEDALQGGDASRFSVAVTYERVGDDSAFRNTFFIIQRNMRLLEDFTGFLLDGQELLQTPHDQRGDLIDMSYDDLAIGGSGLGRWSTTMGGYKQEIDLGYFARVDTTTGTQYRNTVPGDIPYATDIDEQSNLVDIGLYADTSLRLQKYLTLRGGVRMDTFEFNVNNLCAAQGDFDNPSPLLPPINQPCHDQMANGLYREPQQRQAAGGSKIMPRATVLVGPIEHLNFSASYGRGVRSVDPTYVTQDLGTPFASVEAYDAGITYARDFGFAALSLRGVAFVTKVDHDLIFDETAGRNVLSTDGTTRKGWTGAIRLAGEHFDEAANITVVDPTFNDTHLQIPYVPTQVLREDFAAFTTLPWRIAEKPVRGTLGLGYSFVGHRALPYNQQSDVLSVVDMSATAGWFGWSLSLAVTNLFDVKYRLGEYNYASDFHTQPQPTLVPERMFSAGAPRAISLSLAKTLGG